MIVKEVQELIQLYYGCGKGKTSAAIGAAIRMIGHGKRVLIVQFLKDGTSGEMAFLQELSSVDLLYEPLPALFIYQLDEECQKQVLKQQYELYVHTLEIATGYDMIVLDEVLDFLYLNELSYEQFMRDMNTLREQHEIIITGHTLNAQLLTFADYASEIISHKHPYDSGIQAREGIEF